MLGVSASLDHPSAFVGFMMLTAILYGWRMYKVFRYILKISAGMPALGAISFWLVAGMLQAFLFVPVYWLAADVYNGTGNYSDYTEFLDRFTLFCSEITAIGYIGHTVHAAFHKKNSKEYVSIEEGFNATANEVAKKIRLE